MPLNKVVDNQDQLVVVIAVKRFYIDSGESHVSALAPELTRLALVQPLEKHFPLFKPDLRRL